jgi:hypothetical protein
MKPPPAIFCGQVDLQVARQSYLRQVSHIQVMWRRRGLLTSNVCKQLFVEHLTTIDITFFVNVRCKFSNSLLPVKNTTAVQILRVKATNKITQVLKQTAIIQEQKKSFFFITWGCGRLNVVVNLHCVFTTI